MLYYGLNAEHSEQPLSRSSLPSLQPLLDESLSDPHIDGPSPSVCPTTRPCCPLCHEIWCQCPHSIPDAIPLPPPWDPSFRGSESSKIIGERIPQTIDQFWRNNASRHRHCSSFDKLALAGPNVVAKHKPAKKELEHALRVGESDNPVGLGSLRMISYNVRSLSPGSLARAKAHGVNANLKLELLDEDLHKRGYDVVFLQEHGLKRGGR